MRRDACQTRAAVNQSFCASAGINYNAGKRELNLTPPEPKCPARDAHPFSRGSTRANKDQIAKRRTEWREPVTLELEGWVHASDGLTAPTARERSRAVLFVKPHT